MLRSLSDLSYLRNFTLSNVNWLSMQMGLLYFSHQSNSVQHLCHLVYTKSSCWIPHGTVRYAWPFRHQVKSVITVFNAFGAVKDSRVILYKYEITIASEIFEPSLLLRSTEWWSATCYAHKIKCKSAEYANEPPEFLLPVLFCSIALLNVRCL